MTTKTATTAYAETSPTQYPYSTMHDANCPSAKRAVTYRVLSMDAAARLYADVRRNIHSCLCLPNGDYDRQYALAAVIAHRTAMQTAADQAANLTATARRRAALVAALVQVDARMDALPGTDAEKAAATAEARQWAAQWGKDLVVTAEARGPYSVAKY
jgi:hypothetical protein